VILEGIGFGNQGFTGRQDVVRFGSKSGGYVEILCSIICVFCSADRYTGENGFEGCSVESGNGDSLYCYCADDLGDRWGNGGNAGSEDGDEAEFDVPGLVGGLLIVAGTLVLIR
jgi:hypothetical protein